MAGKQEDNEKNNTSKSNKNRGDGKFQKGREKTGGRTKGGVNKKTADLIEAIKAKFPNYNPVVAMAEIGNDAKNPIEIRLSAHKEVAQYMFPKRKAVEHKLGDNEIHSMSEFMEGLQKVRK